MILREIGPDEKKIYNDFVASSSMGHLIQSWEWGEFKGSQGTPPRRFGVFEGSKILATAQLTLHRVPRTHYQIAYLPKGPVVSGDFKKILPTMVDGLKKLAIEENLIFLKAEPKIEVGSGWEEELKKLGFGKSKKWLFTEYNFVLDLKGSEEEILSRMKKNGRYYIKFAEKKGVRVEEDGSPEALAAHLKLQRKTASRQKFLVHADSYYQDLWERLHREKMAYLLAAKFEGKIVATWLVLHFGKTLYYTFGTYDTDYKDLNAMSALAWSAIKLGRSLGCEEMDLWGAADPTLGEKQAIWGSHQFKDNFGPKLVHFVGPYDLPFKSLEYRVFAVLYGPALKLLSWLK